MSKSTIPPTCSAVRQIIDEKGDSYQSFITDGLWVGTNKYQSFGGYSEGNEVIPIITGEDYYKKLIKAFKGAKKEIYINGWQVSWDALLSPDSKLLSLDSKRPIRLFELLLDAATRGVNIYVLLWNDTDPMQTYDDQTKDVLLQINVLVKEKRVHVKLQNASAVPDPGDLGVIVNYWTLFAHHQKQVVVDRTVGFVGGFDLSYGRYDDDTYELKADAQGRKALNRYNPSIVPMGIIPKEEIIEPDHLTGLLDWGSGRDAETLDKIKNGAYQSPYDTASPGNPVSKWIGVHNYTLDPVRQPRMPWQDVEVQVTGPAVSDLALNFILRWNAEIYNQDVSFYNRKEETKKIAKEKYLALPKPAKEFSKVGSCTLQVLRSASKKLRDEEYTAITYAPEGNARFSGPDRAQDDIYKSMLNLIRKSEHFIYIEIQFFVSYFGEHVVGDQIFPVGTYPPLVGPAAIIEKKVGKRNSWWTTSDVGTSRKAAGLADALPTNQICQALGNRIQNAILYSKPEPFHVYITLPVYPEIRLDDGSCITQVYWTMQTLVFGTYSLLNRIRRALKAREMMNKGEKLCDSEGNDLPDSPVYKVLNNPYDLLHKEIPLKKCFDYVTLLNLRNWDKLDGGRYVTEQIYIHSKCMIVDDRYAIVGSANINDRSLLGKRDSELAVMILDEATEKQDICGNKKPQEVRQFAQILRKAIWRKIFGITGRQRSAEAELKTAIDEPANPNSWQKIQQVAQRNTELYEAAFKFIPRNEPAYGIDDDVRKELAKDGKKPPTHASIWPVWNYYVAAKGKETKEERGGRENDGKQQGFMPFQTEFWVADHTKTAQAHWDAAKAHQETVEAHEKATGEHQRALEAHTLSQQAHLNTSLADKVYRAQVVDHQETTDAAHKATEASKTQSKNVKIQTDDVAKKHYTQNYIKTAEVEAKNAADTAGFPLPYAEWAQGGAATLVVLSASYRQDMQALKATAAKKKDAKSIAAAKAAEENHDKIQSQYGKIMSWHKEAIRHHQNAAKQHGKAVKAHTQAAEDHDFTADPKGQAAAAQLNQVKGYITLLPIHWTEGENNNMGYHTAVITKNERLDPFGEGKTEAVAHAEQSQGEKPA